MAGVLDIFTIAFQSDGLKDFETELKRNEAELARYEKQVAETEKKMKSLADAGKSDTVEYKKLATELEQAKQQVKLFGDSVTRLKGDPQASVLELRQKFSSLVTTVGKIATVGLAIKKALNFAEQGQQLDWLAQKAGITAEKLSTIGNAARAFGGTTEGTAGTMENLRSQYQSLLMGEGGGALEQATFKYGVQISSDPAQMLENIAKRMETLKSDAEKWDLAKTLGLDEGTTRLLIQGLDKYRASLERASKYKIFTQDDINRMREYQQISGDIRMGIDSIFNSIYRAMLPALTEVAKVIRNITDWLATHSGMTKILATLAAVAVGIMSVTSGVKLLNVAFKVLAGNPAVLMWAGIVAGITAVIAVIQDIYTWLNGGKAVFGDFYQSVADNFSAALEFVRNFWDGLTDVPADAFEWLFTQVDEIKATFNQLKEFFTDLWNGFGDGVKTAFQGIIEWIKNKLASLVDWMPERLKKWLGLENFTTDSPKDPDDSSYISPYRENERTPADRTYFSPDTDRTSDASRYISPYSENESTPANTSYFSPDSENERTPANPSYFSSDRENEPTPQTPSYFSPDREKERTPKTPSYFSPDREKERTSKNNTYISPWEAAARGQTMLIYANQSPLNSAPAGAVSNYYSTQATNQTMIDNTKTYSQSKSFVIQNMTVKTDNPKSFMEEGMQTAVTFDNGFE